MMKHRIFKWQLNYAVSIRPSLLNRVCYTAIFTESCVHGTALNMGVVLFAMGGYGTYLGWNMRGNPSEKMELATGPGAFLGKSTVKTLSA